MLLGTVGACIHGAALPCMIIVFGDMVDSFVGFGALIRVLGEQGISPAEYFMNVTIQE